jgi:medium-chain acyl-[acyl-carrier-protein] hydrolase
MKPMTAEWFALRKPNSLFVPRMFCFPYAGGNEVIFHQWGHNLPTVEVYSARLPGRGRRIDEAPFTQLTPLVEAIAGAIVPLLDREFSFFGHSMGAVIAFELAQLLRREHGLSPAHLFVSGRNAPHTPERRPPTYHLPDADIIEDLRRLNGTPPEVLEDPEFRKLLMRVVRADFELIQTYKYSPQPPLDCPITAFGGGRDEDVWHEDIELWRDHTTGVFENVTFFDGNHFFIHTHAQLLFHELSRRLVPLSYAFQTAG